MKGKKLLSIALSLLMAQSIVATTAVSSSAVDTQQVVSNEEISIYRNDNSKSVGLASASESSELITSGDYKYCLNEGTAEIVGYTGTAENVIIPSTIDGVRVTKIGLFSLDGISFGGAFQGNTQIKSVVIPNGVTTIDDLAFEGCTSLNSIEIPNSVTTIDSFAFYGCTSLCNIEIPDSVASIEYKAFHDTAWYNNQPDGLVYIGKFAYDYKGITTPPNKKITLQAGTKGIVSNAFEYCDWLTEIIIPTSVTYIGAYAFYQCDLTNITIPESVKRIGGGAFWDCASLESVTISDGMTSIGHQAFWKCSSLADITIPDSVSYIGELALFGTEWYNQQNDGLVYAGKVLYEYKGENRSDITTLTLKSTTKGIAGRALLGCSSLKNISIPNSVTHIGEHAFSSCTSLTSVTIPNSVTDIKYEAFFGCTSLKRVTIPRNVTAIGKHAFGYKINSDYEYEKIPNFTIQGYKGTVAETYANENGFNFVALKDTVNPTSIKLNKATITLGVGESFTLTKTVTPSNASTSYSWSSSNTSVATVNTSGKITAKKTGTANITVKTSNGKTATCKVTVKNAPTSNSLNKTKLTLGVGETFDFNSSIPSGSASYNVKYTSSNTSVATVNASGGIMTAKKAGTAIITSTTYNGKKATCTVTVKNAPSKVSLNKTKLTVGVGETFDFNCTIPNGTASYRIKYTSNNTSVATVKASGGIMTAKKAGTATITATTHNGKKATCIVTVKNAPSKISLNKTKITVGVGETFDFNSSLPSGTASYSVKYTSNNTSVATVKASGGLMTAKKAGTAVITATTYNGKKATCVVTVKNTPSRISLNKTKITLNVGQTFDLNSSLPSGTASYSVKYTSNNTGVATVKASGGLVTAKKKGTATITATTYNGKKATCVVTVK